MTLGENLFQKYQLIAEKDLQLLEQITEKKIFEKGVIIIDEGEVNSNFYFVLNGFVRGYYTDIKGNEHNVFLAEKGLFFGSPEGILDEKQTKYTFETLSDTEVLVFDFKTFEKTAIENPLFFDFYSTAFKNILKIFIGRLESFVRESPEERFLNLKIWRPELFKNVFQKYLAGFLGISNNSLSRIKKRVQKRK